MIKYLAKRLLMIILVGLGVSLITFGIMQLIPGNSAETIAMSKYGLDISATNIETITKEYGLDEPAYIRYLKWLSHVFRGDFGYSFINNGPVLDEILARFPATLKLASAAALISTMIAVPLGIISAVRKNTLIDYTCTTLALTGVCIPTFWLALIMILIFAVNLKILPVCGYGGIEYTVLPTLCLAAGYTAMTMRLLRVSMIEALGQEYILVTRARGLAEKVVILAHAFRNALIPVITIIGMQFGHLLEGAVIVESVFGWPGIGKLLVDSIYTRDYPLILGCVMFVGLIVALNNLIVDVAYIFIDPRLRLGDRSVYGK